MQQLIALEGVLVFHATENRQIDGVLVLGARGQSRSEHDLLSGNLIDRERIAERQLVLGQGAGLVGTQHVDARQFLDGHQLADDRLLLGQQTRAHRHRDRQHCRHCHGDGGYRQHQGKLQGSEDCIAAVQREGNDHSNEHHREDDQIVADLQHRLLEVADGVGLLHQLCSLAEIGLFTSGIYQCANFAPAHDRSGENRLAGIARGGQGFTGQR